MSYYPSHSTLKCFEATARLLSFTHAARELNLTQGAVSHHVLKLEKQLSVSLFDRSNGKLVLTEVGKNYLHEIKPALELIERATDRLRNSSNPNIVIRVAVPPTFAEHWLMARLNQFTLQHRGIKLQIVVHSGGGVNKDDVDAGFELSTGEYPHLESIKVLPLVYRPYILQSKLELIGLSPGELPSKNKLLELLARHELLQSSTLNTWQGWLKQQGLLDKISIEHVASGPRYATASLTLQAAIDGVGIALLPDYVLSRMPANTPLACLDQQGWLSDRAYYMYWHKPQQESRALQDLIAWAHREFSPSVITADLVEE